MTASWNHKVSPEAVPESGAHFKLQADENARAEIAKSAGLRSLPHLVASFDLTRRGTQGLHIAGEVKATVGQNCVVTLEPIDSDINETFEVDFAPEAVTIVEDDQREATIDLNAAEPPEPLIGGAVDLGAVATEFLLLAIDPYPREEGAVFEPRIAGDPNVNPFAALASLKKDKGED